MTLTLKVIQISNGAGEGYAIVQTKSHGLNKGVTTLAAFCGGNLGKRLAAQIAVQLADELLADDLTFEPAARIIEVEAPAPAAEMTEAEQWLQLGDDIEAMGDRLAGKK